MKIQRSHYENDRNIIHWSVIEKVITTQNKIVDKFINIQDKVLFQGYNLYKMILLIKL